jgi:ABC-2 type transport system permease protein
MNSPDPSLADSRVTLHPEATPQAPNALRGFYTLFYKEILRFWKVAFQTIAAPLVTTLLYLLIFSHVLSGRVEVFPGVGYTQFLVPGLVMMSMLQNAFANSSSSLAQSKITGNIIFVLLPPFSHWEFFAAYLAAAMVRGLVVGTGVYLAALPFAPLPVHSILWILAFGVVGTGMTGVLGIICGIWADKFDQLASFQNFVILPLTFLSGVFYSIHGLPEFWQKLSHLNPFFYTIDGFRYGFFGHADVSPWLSFSIVLTAFVALSLLTFSLIKTGYKLRH